MTNSSTIRMNLSASVTSLSLPDRKTDNEEWYNNYYNDLAVVPIGVFQVIIIPNISLIIPVRVLTKIDFNILYPLRCKLEYFYYLCTLKGII